MVAGGTAAGDSEARQFGTAGLEMPTIMTSRSSLAAAIASGFAAQSTFSPQPSFGLSSDPLLFEKVYDIGTARQSVPAALDIRIVEDQNEPNLLLLEETCSSADSACRNPAG